MKIPCLLILLVAGSAVHATSNFVSGAQTPGPIVLGDSYVEAEGRTRAWLEYSGTVAGGWRLSLRLPTNTFQIGKPIAAMVVYKNVSTNQLRLYVAVPGLPYMFSSRVFDEANKDLPMTDQALDQMEDGHSSLSRFRSVSPGVCLAFPLELDHFYQFKTPGTWHVHVTAHGPLLDTSPPLSTGVAKIRIVAANPASGTTVPDQSAVIVMMPATNRFVPPGQN
ncbi:MAG: hypothetical protein WBN75_07020 [Verrucomicrobiia bacterium]|jgi:hypothetical protein